MARRRAVEIGDEDLSDGPSIQDGEFIEGSDEACELLHKWFSAIVKSPDVESGFRAILLQAGKGQEKTVQPFTYTLDIDIKDFVEDIVDVAEDYAKNFRQAVRFAVRVAIGGKPATRKCFVLRVPRTELEEQNTFLDGPSDYSPDGAGVTALAVDLAQGFARDIRAGAQDGVSVYREITKELREEIRELKAENAELKRERDDVSNMKWALEDAREDKRREGERKEMLFRGLMKGGQMLLGTLASGQSGIPGGMLGAIGGMGAGMMNGPDPNGSDEEAPQQEQPYQGGPALCGSEVHRRQDLVLDAFIERLTAAKVQKLMESGIFDPEELGLFGELHRLSFERKEAAAQAEQAHAAARAQHGANGYGYTNGNGAPIR